MELVEAKRKGEAVVTDGEPEPAAGVVDLMKALEQSLRSPASRPEKARSRDRGRRKRGRRAR
jgi:non-homologous end joining protein Ku